MTYGVVSILDDKHSNRVEKIWQGLKAEFGIHGVHQTPIPHFSYHVADHYEQERLSEVLDTVSQAIAPFTARTTGLGLFTGGDPVIFVPVIRTAALETIHEQVYEAIQAANITTGEFVYYQLPRWIPHITLTHKDVGHDMLPQVIRFLSGRDFTWDIKIDNLSLIGGEGIHGQIAKFPLRG